MRYTKIEKIYKHYKNNLIINPVKRGVKLPSEEEIKELLENYGFKEPDKDEKKNIVPFPKPIKKYRLLHEAYNQNIEELYYWILGHLRDDWQWNVEKIKDIFAAAEASAFFGVTQQRAALQQDQVAKYLKYCADMTKELFQLVREMRVLDERISYYENTGMWLDEKGNIIYDPNKEKDPESSEITLKGIWIDLVEGGAKNPASVYGLAREVGFTILPDLFFRTRIKEGESIDKKVEELEFNPKVLEVLKRKLNQYYTWKKRTYRELKTRRLFTLRYLRQHYDTIKLYIDWIKPYLVHIRKLQGKERTWDEDLIGAFEGSLVEIEILATKNVKEKYKPVILINWDHRTKPAMAFHAEGYQRGPVHVGRTIITMRAYSWTEEQIKKYKEMRADEDMGVLSSIDASLKTAIDSLGDELKNYLKEAGETFIEKKTEETKPKEEGILEPFAAVVKGFGEIAGAFLPKKEKKKEKISKFMIKADEKASRKTALKTMWQVYKNFKKSHGFITW